MEDHTVNSIEIEFHTHPDKDEKYKLSSNTDWTSVVIPPPRRQKVLCKYEETPALWKIPKTPSDPKWKNHW